MNVCIFTGNVGNDLELKKTESGVSVINFSLAVNDEVNKETTHWLDFVVWDKYAEVFYTHVKKGDRLLIQARCETSTYKVDEKTRKRVSFVVTKFEFMNTKKKSDDEFNMTYEISEE